MVHTFKLTHKTNKKKVIKILSENYPTKDMQALLTATIQEGGFQIPTGIPGIIKVSISEINATFYRISLRVEPQSLIKGRRTIDLFDCSDESKQRLKVTLDNAIKYFSTALPQVERWIVSRIDYTMDLLSDDVKLCVELAKMGKDPYRYRDNIKKPGSSYRQSNSVILNFYDKLDHIGKKVDSSSRDSYLLNEAENIFRIEIQCLNKDKLKHIREKFNLPLKATLSDYLRSDIAIFLIHYYYRAVIGYGDYYSMDKAHKLIESTNLTARKKANITNWLRLIAQARGVSNAREQFIVGTQLGRTGITVKGCHNTFNSYVECCRKIGINPVTIPKSKRKKYLGNPLKSVL